MIARLAIAPNTRHLAIRHLLAVVIFSNLDTHTVGPLTLLPPTVKELYLSRRTFRQKDQPPRLETALRSWHRMTAFLLHENPGAQTHLQPPLSVKSKVEDIIAILQESLDHFVRIDNYHSPRDQQSSLTNVFGTSVELGYEIFSHPCEWEFMYPEDEHAIFITPGVKLITDNRGVPHDPPLIALAPEIVAIESYMVKEYFLAPNFTTAAPPEGPIKLGSILRSLVEFEPLNPIVEAIPTTQLRPVDVKESFEISLHELHSIRWISASRPKPWDSLA
ncbi:hypothetical protein ACHAPY_002209 [Fusarium culmorum]